MAKALSEMSERELEATYKKEEENGSKITSDMIAAGRGTEKPSETRQKDDALSRRLNEHFDRMRPINDERAARMRYHGNLRPIKKHRF